MSDRMVFADRAPTLAKQNFDSKSCNVREKSCLQKKRIWTTSSPPPLTILDGNREYVVEDLETARQRSSFTTSEPPSNEMIMKPAHLHTARGGFAPSLQSEARTPQEECSLPRASIRLPVISSSCMKSSEFTQAQTVRATAAPFSLSVLGSPLAHRSISASSLPAPTAAVHPPGYRPQSLFHLKAPQPQHVSASSWMMPSSVQCWPVGSAVSLLTPLPLLFYPRLVSPIQTAAVAEYHTREVSPPAAPGSSAETPLRQGCAAESASSMADSPSTAESVCSPRSLQDFVQHFKERRTRLGYTQTDVGLELRSIYGLEFSQATICRFESLQLSYDNLCRWKVILEAWLRVAEERGPDWQSDRSLLSRRRRRTPLGPAEKSVLERHYNEDDTPNTEHMERIARELGLERRVVRTWFCNQRQKVKRQQVFSQLAVENSSEMQPSRSATLSTSTGNQP